MTLKFSPLLTYHDVPQQRRHVKDAAMINWGTTTVSDDDYLHFLLSSDV